MAAVGVLFLGKGGRFLTLTLFAVIYLLARDEERRRLNRFGESHATYLNVHLHTGEVLQVRDLTGGSGRGGE